jgi:hypothetical protein
MFDVSNPNGSRVIETWSFASLRQRIVKTGGQLVKHVRNYWILLTESYLPQRLFGSTLRRMEGLPVPCGYLRAAAK